MWLDPDRTVINMVWWHPWTADVTAEFLLSTNPHGTINNSYLELVASFYRRPPSSRQSPRLAWRHRAQVLKTRQLSPGSRMKP